MSGAVDPTGTFQLDGPNKNLGGSFGDSALGLTFLFAAGLVTGRLLSGMDIDLLRAVLGGASSIALGVGFEGAFTVLDRARVVSSNVGGDVTARWARFGDPVSDLAPPVLGNATYMLGGRGFFLNEDSFSRLLDGGMQGRGDVGGGWLCGGRLGISVLGIGGIGSVGVRMAGVEGVDAACVASEPDEDRG